MLFIHFRIVLCVKKKTQFFFCFVKAGITFCSCNFFLFFFATHYNKIAQSWFTCWNIKAPVRSRQVKSHTPVGSCVEAFDESGHGRVKTRIFFVCVAVLYTYTGILSCCKIKLFFSLNKYRYTYLKINF